MNICMSYKNATREKKERQIEKRNRQIENRQKERWWKTNC